MRESGRTKAMLCELVIVALFLALSAGDAAAPLRRLQQCQPRKRRRSPAPTSSRRTLWERFTAGEELPQREEYRL